MPKKGIKRGAEKAPGVEAASGPATEREAGAAAEVKNAAAYMKEDKKADAAKTAVYMRGRDWAILERTWRGRVYYQIRTYESERTLADKLAEAFTKAAEKGLTDKVAVTYTRFFRDKYAQVGFYKNTLIIKMPDYISYLRVKWLLDVADKVARSLYGDVAVDTAAEEEPEEA